MTKFSAAQSPDVDRGESGFSIPVLYHQSFIRALPFVNSGKLENYQSLHQSVNSCFDICMCMLSFCNPGFYLVG